MRPAGQSRGMVLPSRKRKAAAEEIPFDRTARQEYLTGFHKRKLQRIRLAQEEALKREKAERIQDRKKLRDSRKEEIETHIKQVQALSRRAAAQANGDPSDSESEGGWAGIGGDNSDGSEQGGAEELNKQEEYIDEGRFTTVTVEAMDFDAEEKVDSDTERENAAKREEAEKREKERKKRKPKEKEKKKKFRYLTKTERRADRVKVRTKLAKRREKFKDADSLKSKRASKGKKKQRA